MSKDYKKLYEEALERAKIFKSPYCQHATEVIFPELRESEDERIRKGLIKGLSAMRDIHKHQTFSDDAISIDDAIAWLENQANIPHFTYDDILALQCAMKTAEKADNELYEQLKSLHDRLHDAYRLEKQGEQKPADKFEVGDWIINNDKRIAVPTQILKIEKYGYLHLMGYTSFDKVKTDYHLWTIKDAKDGDVLASKAMNKNNIDICIFKSFSQIKNSFVSYCSYGGFGDIFEPKEILCWNNDFFLPATKEQYDLLFAKMKEVGYVWDAENKKLEKIEQSCYHSDGLYYAIDILEKTLGKVEGYQSDDGIIEHQTALETVNALYHKKPEWSEEDEKFLNYAISLTDDAQIKNFLKSLKGRVQPQPKQEWNKEDSERLDRIYKFVWANRKGDTDEIYQQEQDADWLKSLKPRWKPTKLQLEALESAYKQLPNIQYFLQSLYSDLKKL